MAERPGSTYSATTVRPSWSALRWQDALRRKLHEGINPCHVAEVLTALRWRKLDSDVEYLNQVGPCKHDAKEFEQPVRIVGERSE